MSTDLLDILATPDRLVTLPPQQQSQIVRQANHAALLGYLAARVDKSLVTAKLADNLLSAKVHSDFYNTQIAWETHCAEQALGHLEGPVVLLKGAAYRALDLGLAQGRLASDVDLLVPKDQLETAEELLIEEGWEAMKSDEYEQHYYREWMHELPPMQHRDRGTVIDLHHNILPPTSRLKPDATKLLESAVPIPGSALYTLSPTDTVLHRCAHLFIDGDLHNSLRELVDVAELLSLYMDDDGFQDGLVDRSRELNLSIALYYALFFCKELLNSELPEIWLRELEAENNIARSLARSLMEIQLRPHNPTSNKFAHRMSGWLLFIRSHWMRMPLLMLAKHLIRQVWRRRGLKAG